MMTEVFKNNTVKFLAQFLDEEGTILTNTDLSEVVFKIFNSKYEVIINTILTAENFNADNKFFYYYTFPADNLTQTNYIFEFEATYGAYKISNRGRLKTIFVES